MSIRSSITWAPKKATDVSSQQVSWEAVPTQFKCPLPVQNYHFDMPIQQARRQTDLELFEPSPRNVSQAKRALSKLNIKPQHFKNSTIDSHFVATHTTFMAVTLAFSLLFSTAVTLNMITHHKFSVSRDLEQSFSYSGNLLFLRGGNSPSNRIHPRIFFTGEDARFGVFEGIGLAFETIPGREIKIFPAEFTDVTQLYSIKDSEDFEVASTMERRSFPDHETDKDCSPMSNWQLKSFPTCNNIHEANMIDDLALKSLQLVSSTGSWRDAWMLQDLAGNADTEGMATGVIMKTIKYSHTFQDRYFEFSRVDALAMERLTSNPYIMGIHAFCGVSVVTERGVNDIAYVVDHLSPRFKLHVAKMVAEGIAAVHEVDGKSRPVSLVHNDINVGNIFWGRNNVPLLNDFNIAVLMMKENNSNKTCSFKGHFPNPQWKSPEEQVGLDGNSIGDLNEKVDIYALGNLLFRFATGKGPWREMAASDGVPLSPEEKERIAHLKAKEGKMPMVPKKTLELNDPYINIMLKAAEWCYQFKPESRPSARNVAVFLDKWRKRIDAAFIDH